MAGAPIAYLLDVPGLQDTSPRFRRELVRQARNAGLDPSYVAAVISLESGFDPSVQNKLGAPALGLIQFWRDYWRPIAERAGRPNVQWDDLRGMSATEQLPFVFAYYAGTALPSLVEPSPTDYYMATFMPAFVGKPPSFELGRKGSAETVAGLRKGRVYEQNPGLDANKDGSITVGDVGRKIEGIVTRAEQKPRVAVFEESGGSGMVATAGLFFCPSCGSCLFVGKAGEV